jgi:5-dehydro-4-deoxyglucarate dehydratase
MNFQEIKNALSDGLLSFPITDMDEKGNFHNENYAERLKWFISQDISTVFVAGGTGEFFSLSREEYRQIVRTAARVVNGKMPVISSVGRSIPEAVEFAKIAEEAGIDGLLLTARPISKTSTIRLRPLATAWFLSAVYRPQRSFQKLICPLG